MSALKLNDDQFSDLVSHSELPVVAEFSATWCGPCKKMATVMDEISEEYKGKAVVVNCDVEECQTAAEILGIRNVPTVVFYNTKGEPVDRSIGAVPKKAITDKLDKLCQ